MSPAVTHGSRNLQVRLRTGPRDANSQADSAGSIPVTRSPLKAQARTDEAAFAALSGTSPIPASSGRTIRHRLNRGGDWDLNRAIHTIALTRMRSCPRTRAYITRRTAQGKTTREIRRCLR
jgi:hypothetical protein